MANAVKPITPAEAQAAKEAMIPDFVVAAVNRLLSEKWKGKGYVTLTQNEVIAEIQKERDITSGELFDNDFLDFEPYFRKAGWKVSYDKPAYYESYEAHWEFSV